MLRFCPDPSSSHNSCLNAVIGSVFAARRAGSQHAIIATTASSNGMPAKVSGSAALTPYSRFFINDLDATLTVLANGCYRWLAKQLRGFENAAPKQLYRKFVETSGTIEIEQDRIVVRFDKRSHNPILREAALDQPNQKIPWLQNLPVVFKYQ